jgi:hypothetical protein
LLATRFPSSGEAGVPMELSIWFRGRGGQFKNSKVPMAGRGGGRVKIKLRKTLVSFLCKCCDENCVPLRMLRVYLHRCNSGYDKAS